MLSAYCTNPANTEGFTQLYNSRQNTYLLTGDLQITHDTHTLLFTHVSLLNIRDTHLYNFDMLTESFQGTTLRSTTISSIKEHF